MLRKYLKSIFFSLIAFCYKIRYKQLILGGGVRIYPHTSIVFRYCNAKSHIRISKDVKLGCKDNVYRIGWYHPLRMSVMAPDSSIEIGEASWINGVNMFARKRIQIGRFCHIAGGVQISDTNGHLVYRFNRYEVDQPQPIIIGDNVWIGLNSIILKGSEIGNNSVIAAGSVVKGCFPPFSLIAGNPAKLVKIMDEKKFN